jgi:succinate-semialdehyde dehydrogenase / glutarate-semialdehyde dehydrogenase
MTVNRDSHDAGPADPELDPTASYAIDPALARRLSGRLVATSGRTTTPLAPRTLQPVAALPLSSEADVDEAFDIARQAQAEWAETSLSERTAAALRLHDLVFDRQEELLDLMQVESGKVRKHAYEEVAHLAITARYYARTAHRHLRTERRLGVFPLLTRAEVNRLPKGVVGVISPWNYPLTMALSDGLPALIAGNTVVHKPDSQTMLTALAGVELLAEAGFPRDIWQVVHGPGAQIGAAIVDRADFVSFTGSTETGRSVAARAGERLIGASLELGGKNPMLVLRDADIERAAEGAVRGCFSSAGQLCVSIERLYVAEEVFDRFVDRFVTRVRAMRLSVSDDWDGDMGSLVSQAQLDAVRRHVDDAVARGATVLTGGQARPDIGPLFYEPTVLVHVAPEMECFESETFGPVVSVYRFHDEEEAVAQANSGCFGLSASIYTRDTRRGRVLARRIRCGSVNINEPHGATFGSIDSPMGGMGDSGLGRRQGPEGIHRYVETQSVATQRGLPVGIASVLGMSEERYARAMGVGLRLLRRTRRP